MLHANPLIESIMSFGTLRIRFSKIWTKKKLYQDNAIENVFCKIVAILVQALMG